MKKSIDWKGTLRNFILAGIAAYIIASIYFILTRPTAFKAYQDSNVESVIKASNAIDYITYKLGLNKELENKVEAVSTISYATFAIECIKGE